MELRLQTLQDVNRIRIVFAINTCCQGFRLIRHDGLLSWLDPYMLEAMDFLELEPMLLFWLTFG